MKKIVRVLMLILSCASTCWAMDFQDFWDEFTKKTLSTEARWEELIHLVDSIPDARICNYSGSEPVGCTMWSGKTHIFEHSIHRIFMCCRNDVQSVQKELIKDINEYAALSKTDKKSPWFQTYGKTAEALKETHDCIFEDPNSTEEQQTENLERLYKLYVGTCWLDGSILGKRNTPCRNRNH